MRILAAIVFVGLAAVVAMNVGITPEEAQRITSSQEYREAQAAHMARIARQAMPR